MGGKGKITLDEKNNTTWNAADIQCLQIQKRTTQHVNKSDVKLF